MVRTFPLVFVLALLTVPAHAELPFSFGLKGGARLTDFTQNTSSVTKQDHIYTLGPYAEIYLPLGFSLEGDLLYKKSGATLLSAATTTFTSPRQFNFDSFDLPILLKYRIAIKKIPLHPFVGAGLANRYSSGLPGTVVGLSTTSGWQEGIVIGAGLEANLWRLKGSAELRWTRYGNISTQTIPRLNANQAELLLGLGF